MDDATAIKGQHCLDYANSVESMRGLHFQLFEVEIIQIEAKSDLDQHQAQHGEEERQLNERRREVEQLQEEAQRSLAAGKVLEERCKALSEDMDEYEVEVQREIMDWEVEQLDTEIQSVQARLEMTSGAGGENVLREYEQRLKRIEEKKTSLAEIEASLQELAAKITEIRDRWEPRLDALVAHISEAFGENFSRIQCAGEVMVHKDEDFEQWSIEIKVKFRYVVILAGLIERRR
jgi:chromosome segregation ATPase